MAMHIAESELETASSSKVPARSPTVCAVAASRCAPRAESPIQLLADLGVLDVAPLLIHCVRVDARDIATIAGSRFAGRALSGVERQARTWRRARSTSCSPPASSSDSASDSMASNNRMDLLEEARFALLASAGAHRIVGDAGGGRRAGAGDDRRRAGARARRRRSGRSRTGSRPISPRSRLDRVGPTFDPVTAAVFSITGASARS